MLVLSSFYSICALWHTIWYNYLNIIIYQNLKEMKDTDEKQNLNAGEKSYRYLYYDSRYDSPVCLSLPLEQPVD